MSLPCSFLLRFPKLNLFSGETDCSLAGDLGELGEFKYLLSNGDAISELAEEYSVYEKHNASMNQTSFVGKVWKFHIKDYIFPFFLSSNKPCKISGKILLPLPYSECNK